MRIFLFIVTVIAFLIGLVTFITAKSALHEAVGAIFFLIATVSLSGAAIIEAINLLKKEIQKR